MLCDGGQDVNREFVRMWIVHRDELNTRVHQGRDESEIARQSVELRNHQLGLVSLASSQRLYEFGALVAFAGELADQRPAAAVQIIVNSLALCLNAKAGFPLLGRQTKRFFTSLFDYLIIYQSPLTAG
jgi:hypothetical protein